MQVRYRAAPRPDLVLTIAQATFDIKDTLGPHYHNWFSVEGVQRPRAALERKH